MPAGRRGGLLRVEPVIEVRLLHQTILLAAELDELPHAGSLLVRDCARQETRLGLSQVDQLWRNALLIQNPLDHGTVPAGSLHTGDPPLMSPPGEKIHQSQPTLILSHLPLPTRAL